MESEVLMGRSYIQVLKEHYKKLPFGGGKSPHVDVFDGKNRRAYEFIKRVFELYGKDQDNQLLSLLDSVDEDRQRHIVYTFLLGVAIYEESDFVRKRIDEELNLYKDALANQENEFEFVWFLICLFHDLAYPVETRDEIAKHYIVRKYKNLAKKMGEFLLSDPIEVPAFYRGMLVKYYNYRVHRYGCCDHGIIAGLYLYHDMCVNRERQHSVNPQCWNSDLNHVYEFAASIVACHNIWLQPHPNDVPEYKKRGMQPLIAPRRSRLIKIDIYPMFFLFCLVDSMEMSKRKEIALDKLKIDIKRGYIKLDINELSRPSKYIVRYYFLAIDDWLTDARETENGIITISIKQKTVCRASVH